MGMMSEESVSAIHGIQEKAAAAMKKKKKKKKTRRRRRRVMIQRPPPPRRQATNRRKCSSTLCRRSGSMTRTPASEPMPTHTTLSQYYIPLALARDLCPGAPPATGVLQGALHPPSRACSHPRYTAGNKSFATISSTTLLPLPITTTTTTSRPLHLLPQLARMARLTNYHPDNKFAESTQARQVLWPDNSTI
jgi:hypothetical protein